MKFTENDRQMIHTLLESEPLKNGLLSVTGTKPIVIVSDITSISENVWLFLRSLIGIGGSECAGLIGVSPYTNPVKIYKQKFNYLYRDPDPISGKIMTDEEIEHVISILESENSEKDLNTEFLLDYGHYMEQFIADTFERFFATKYKDEFEEKFAKKNGAYKAITDVKVYKDSTLYRHPKYPMFADMDFRIAIAFEDGTIEQGVFECKTASSYLVKSKWENDFPSYYNAQVRQYMCVADVNFFVICCLADNSAKNFFCHLGFREDKNGYEKQLIEKAREFWYNSVMLQKLPKIDEGVDALDDLLSAITIEKNNNINQLGKIVFDLCHKREKVLDIKKEYQASIKKLDEQIAALETQIVSKCGENSNSLASFNDEVYEITLEEKTSSRFNKSKFFKLFPDQKDNYTSCVDKTTKNAVKIKKTA